MTENIECLHAKEKSLSYSDKMHMFMYMYISMHNCKERECPFSIRKDTYPAL